MVRPRQGNRRQDWKFSQAQLGHCSVIVVYGLQVTQTSRRPQAEQSGDPETELRGQSFHRTMPGVASKNLLGPLSDGQVGLSGHW